MNIEQFVTKWTGKYVDFDGVYGYQCMDLMHQYVYEVFGLTDATILAAPTAKDVFLNFKWGHLFTKINNTPEGIPSIGDILFWGTGAGSAGHVAIYLSGDVMKFNSFDQNWPVGSKPHVQLHNYNNVLGWLRFKGVISDPTNELKKKIKELEDKIAKAREVLA